jgi:predicted AlkP superfamily pyrophosphatase or phosphodiesterase
MKKLCFYFLFLICTLVTTAQPLQRPKLVIGIVVDQMRWDYLYRYFNRYSNDGFKRILRDGFSCENTFIPYTPTVTAAGHSCIYTGSVPALHGIVGNNWYDREQKKVVYCTDDYDMQTVGSTSTAGKMSPKNLWSNTITDELRLATNFRNKTIAIALKDRGAILPGGHTANAAYWFDNATGTWITSSYYMQSLPQWVQTLNAKRLPDAYLKQNWNTLYPINTYVQSTADNEPYENNLMGEDNTFPHNIDTITNNKYEMFRSTPYGNTFTFDMAKAVVENEQLGKRGETDFLAVSFSSTDYVGHGFGPNSIEAEDVYLRFDRDLGDFLKYLDGAVGKGQYLFFLTADHGAAHVPAYVKENKMPGGTLSESSLLQQLNDQLKKDFSVTGLVTQVMNYQIYLDYNVINQNNLDIHKIKQDIIQALLKNPGIAAAYDLTDIQEETVPQQLKTMLTNSYNQKMSGDIQFIFKPQWFEGGNKGTTHGLWNPYDAHIPLLWFGWGIRSGSSNREVYMTDISATIAALLHIQMPNACVGKVIEEVKK